MRFGSRAAGRSVVAAVVWLTAGCAAAPCLIFPSGGGIERADVDRLLAIYPLGAAENIRPVLLGQTELLSYHLVQIRDREQPHVHATHDVTVTLLRGNGTLHLRGTVQEMRVGDAAVIPRGTPHYFVNTDSAPAVAFVTFAPPYDGKDQVLTAESHP